MRDHKHPHILYVEDDNDACQMMTALLEISGIDVTCATGMSNALIMAHENRFDLFLLDLWLHDGDGNDLCERLRVDFPNVPVVFYTGGATEREKKQGLASGAAAYLVKPYSELIAPMIFRLVTGVDAVDLFARSVDPLEHMEEKTRRFVNIMRSSGRTMPLSP